ncbi:MAG TPA: signal recognition particle receptor subunit alpha, partial [Rhodoblastus sp.]|nr:signal recognition particle receptor subunit alpha [Rhodoblastus sp.]
MADGDGETKKPGLFGRMFGRKAEADREPSGSQPDAAPAAAPSGTQSEPEGSRPNPPAEKTSWWKRLKSGLARSSSSIGQGITDVFTKRKLDSAALEDLEDILVRADLGVGAATRIVEAVGKGRYDKEVSADEVRTILASEVEKSLTPVAKPLVIDAARKPFVVLVVGVNGSGKTTTIAKLTQRLRGEGKSVVLAAGDTFRAAAIEQLKVWGDRLGAPVISGAPGADAAGLAFDALTQAREKQADVV